MKRKYETSSIIDTICFFGGLLVIVIVTIMAITGKSSVSMPKEKLIIEQNKIR